MNKKFLSVLIISNLLLINKCICQSRNFCATDSRGQKYELSITEGSVNISLNSYSKDGIKLGSIYGTWSLRDEGVYGPANYVTAQFSNGPLKLLVIRDGSGNIQQLEDASLYKRVFYPCGNNNGGKSSVDDGSNYPWNQEKVAKNGIIDIGRQAWASMNLSVNAFRNGDLIPEAKTKEEWVKYLNEKKPAWCYYDNNPDNGTKYGKLYNWYALKDERNIAPEGWRVPTGEDWNKLKILFGSRGGNKMKARKEWAESAISSETKFSNTSGFKAMPGGYRYDDGSFQGLKYYAVWWSSSKLTESPPPSQSWLPVKELVGNNIGISYSSHELLGFTSQDINAGLSIRLIQDEEYSDGKKSTEPQLILVKEFGDTKYVLTLKHDAKSTASMKIYNNKNSNLIEGNWKKEQVPVNTDKITFSYLKEIGSGSQVVYKYETFILNCEYYNPEEYTKIHELNKPNEKWIILSNTKTTKPKDDALIQKTNIIGTPYKIGELEIAENDFSEIMTLNNAKKVVDKIGNGWRIPNHYELKFLLSKKNYFLNLNEYSYLSSSLFLNNGEFLTRSKIGKSEIKDSTFKGLVRVVKGFYSMPTFEEEMSLVIGTPLKINTLEVAENDYDDLLGWGEANKRFSSYSGGWRLPSKEELMILYKNKINIGGFVDEDYWTSSEYDDQGASKIPGYWYINFSNGSQLGGKKRELKHIRLVRLVN